MQKLNSHYCPKKDVVPQFLLPFNYTFIEKIGEGSYGQVFKIFDVEKTRLLIVKKQKISQSDGVKHKTNTSFAKQHQLLTKLSHYPGFPQIGPFFTEIDSQYFFMQCLGNNLQQLVSKHGTFSIQTVKYIGFQILNKLQILHEMNYLHRDIKTQNILVGNAENPHEVYIVDFGLAFNYRRNGKQVSRKKYSGLVGTARYASIAAHKCQQQSPKDDLESLGYVLSYCLIGHLQWQSLNIQNREQKFDKIMKLKISTSLDRLSKDFISLKSYYNYVRNLNYEDTPDYEYLKNILGGSNYNTGRYCFEWCGNNCKKLKQNINNYDNKIKNQMQSFKNQMSSISRNSKTQRTGKLSIQDNIGIQHGEILNDIDEGVIVQKILISPF